MMSPPTGRLTGKVAIVTGAGAIGPGWGNGKATAVAFAREGASVMAVDRNEAAAVETRDIIRAEGAQCEVMVADVGVSADVARCVEATLAAFGRVDVLHNNVGIFCLGGPVELEESDWDGVITTNLKSLFLTCKYVLPYFEKQRSGAIINVGSISGHRHMGVPADRLRHLQGRHRGVHSWCGGTIRSLGNPRKCCCSGFDRYAITTNGRRCRLRGRHGSHRPRCHARRTHLCDSTQAFRGRVGRRCRERIPRLGRGALHHRR